MSKIKLENMQFHAYHGCLEHEKREGNTFLITVIMDIDTSKAEQTDLLDDTLNYQLVYDLVKAQMEIPSELIEHIACRILRGILTDFPQVNEAIVQLAKLNPPLGGKVQSVSIELSGKREPNF
jgi:7,8-dihydroneopterin aldolase/epimerase/oxygenase